MQFVFSRLLRVLDNICKRTASKKANTLYEIWGSHRGEKWIVVFSVVSSYQSFEEIFRLIVSIFMEVVYSDSLITAYNLHHIPTHTHDHNKR
jgi:hypothetical protein